jgi:hypothetical protein
MNVPDSHERIPDLLRQRKGPRPLWSRCAWLLAAAIFFVLGVAFWLIPVVTGIPFYIAALVCLGLASDRVGERINAAERRLSHHKRLKLREWLRRAPIRKLREMGCMTDERESPAREPAGTARGP